MGVHALPAICAHSVQPCVCARVVEYADPIMSNAFLCPATTIVHEGYWSIPIALTVLSLYTHHEGVLVPHRGQALHCSVERIECVAPVPALARPRASAVDLTVQRYRSAAIGNRCEQE